MPHFTKPVLICVSETYLDKSADTDALSIDGYNIIRADHITITRRELGHICIYFKEQLKLKEIITPNFPECIFCEIKMGNKTGFIAVTYRCPSQTAGEFDNFLENFLKNFSAKFSSLDHHL